MVLFSILGLAVCSIAHSIEDVNGPWPPLPVDVEALRSSLLALRRSPQQPLTSQNRQHLAVSRANSFAHPHSHSQGWLALRVHFTVPVNSATLAALADVVDGAVTASLGHGAFAVTCKAEALNRIRSFPGVASVRLRTAIDKRASHLAPAFHATNAPSNATTDRGHIHVHCRCLQPSQSCASRIESILKAHDCAVSSSHAPQYKAMGVCPARAAAAASAAVANLGEVDWVEETLPFVAHDFASRQILWDGNASFFNASYASALNGSGQIIAIADTGLDMTNCFFHYGQTANFANTNTRIDAGNVHTYWTMDDCSQCGQCPRACSDLIDLEGHGTHVSGIAAGRANTALSGGGAAAKENGLAAGASIFFQDISASSGIITPPIHLEQLFSPAYSAGARVHSNSWGCSADKPTDCNSYSLSASEVDAFMNDHPDFLVVFAAGNSGSVDSSVIGTVGSPATCKNCLSVGSSNIGLAGAAHNWQYTSTLDMCKRSDRDGKFSLPSPCCSAGEDAGSACSLLALSCCPWDPQTVCCFNEAAATANASASGKPMMSHRTLSYFSSVGPTRDGRLKPDVVAPGNMIASSNSRANFGNSASVHCNPPPAASSTNVDWSARAVQLMSGTSMATPAIAAVAAIVRQWFQEGWYPSGSPNANATINPSAALVRAVIAASATSLNANAPLNTPPSAKSGWGLPSLARALYVSSAGGSSRIIVVDASSFPPGGSASVRHGVCNVVTALCSGGHLQVALAWTDLPGHPSAIQQLVNDLDLLVWSIPAQGAQTTLLYGNGAAVADSLNNLEKVSTTCSHGHNVTVAVCGAVVLSPIQFYALVISGAIVASTLTAINTSQAVMDAAANGRSVQVTVQWLCCHRSSHSLFRVWDLALFPQVHRVQLLVTAAARSLPALSSRTSHLPALAQTRTYPSRWPICCAFPFQLALSMAEATPSFK